MREILWASQPVNVMVDLQTGQGEIEIRGVYALQVKTGETWSNRKPGRQAAVFAQADAMPKAGGLLRRCGTRASRPRTASRDRKAVPQGLSSWGRKDHLLPCVARRLSGPGGKNKDRVFVVDAADPVTVLSIK